MKISLKMPDFIKTISRKELFLYLIEGELLVLGLCYFFYKSFFWILILSPVSFLFVRYKADEALRNKRWEMLLQFKEVMVSINSSIQAGYSVNSAFALALADVTGMYGEKAAIVSELKTINRGLANGVPLEGLLHNMSKRNSIEEIENFAGLMSTYKKTGGNIVDIIRTYVTIIEERVALRQEIETMISAKKYEQKIMNLVPFIILFYVDITSKGFFDVLYHNIAGNIIMTIVMSIYLTAVCWSNKIINKII